MKCDVGDDSMMTYADGSGNVFVISDICGKTLEYRPVKPEFSSSGEYDGGKPGKKALSDSQFAQIRLLFIKAIRNTKSHLEDRVKGSGLILLQEFGTDRSRILAPGAPEQQEIEILLKNILR